MMNKVMTYYATLIKNYNGIRKGKKVGPYNKENYLNMLNGGYIEDEHNLKEPKPKKKTPTEPVGENNESNN